MIKDIATEQKNAKELKEFDSNLIRKVKWLVLNKIDLISKEEQKKIKDHMTKSQDLNVDLISAKQRLGTENLMKKIGFELEKFDE